MAHLAHPARGVAGVLLAVGLAAWTPRHAAGQTVVYRPDTTADARAARARADSLRIVDSLLRARDSGAAAAPQRAPASSGIRGDTTIPAVRTEAARGEAPAPQSWFERNNLITVARTGGLGLDLFARLVDAAGWAQRLAGGGPYTALAPSDSALAAIPDLEAILGNRARAEALVRRHLVAGSLTAARLLAARSPTTVDGAPLAVERLPDGNISLNGVPLRIGDVVVSNGVIHVIGRVLR